MTTRLRETTTTQTTLEDSFAYTADFSNIEDWDPGVAESSQIGSDPIGVGTAFDVLVAFGSRRLPMVYTITEYDPPRRVVLVGEGSTLTAVDTIEFAAKAEGTEITYTADLTFKGIARFFTPFMGSKLNDVGLKAVAGLRTALHKRQPTNDSRPRQNLHPFGEAGVPSQAPDPAASIESNTTRDPRVDRNHH